MPTPYSAKAIANHFLGLAKADNTSLTPMKVQKLIYFAHGWHLAINGTPLISEQVQAWKFGPVIQSVYHEFKNFGANSIKGYATDIDPKVFDMVAPVIDENDANVKALLAQVWRVYGRLNGIQLSNMTHEPDTPWDITWKKSDGLLEAGIDNEEIQKYFVAKAQHGRAVAAN